MPKPRRGASPGGTPRRRWPLVLGLAACGVIGLGVVAALVAWGMRPAGRSEAADLAWIEARTALKEGRASVAEKALERASSLDPRDPEPWLLRLEILRVEDRQVEASLVGWRAYESVPEAARRKVLRALTLALLADTPDDVARDTLARWTEADPDDLDARVALLQRIAASSRAGDPGRDDRVDALAKIVAGHADHVAAREALVLALADAGEQPERGRAILDAWPEPLRDARYARLRGRWNLEYEPRDDASAIVSLRKALEHLPHDWRTRSRLARALRNAGKRDEADREASAVELLREVLDPVALGRRLDADLGKLEAPESREDLARLCARVGLSRLAEAWSRDARASPSVPAILNGRPR